MAVCGQEMAALVRLRQGPEQDAICQLLKIPGHHGRQASGKPLDFIHLHKLVPCVAERIPIIPEVLAWARKTAGFKLEDLAATKQFGKIARWESGEEHPTYSQLEKLADKFHRPIAVFFFPRPPIEETLEKSLRSISDSSVENLNPAIHLLFRKAKAFQLSLAELFEGQEDVQKQRVSWIIQANGDIHSSSADKIRSLLDVSIEEQQSWLNPDEAFKEWRRRLAMRGIFVFKDAFKNTDISGFCVYDELFPVIFINNSHAKNRQIFTLFHELSHLILKQSFLDVETEDTWLFDQVNIGNEEALCNRLASEVLVPTSHMMAQIGDHPIGEDIIRELSDYYHVSKEVIARKLLDLNEITQDYYKTAIHQWYAPRETTEDSVAKSGGSYYNTKAAYLGDTYISIVLRNYYRGKIDLIQASDYLDIKPKSFQSLEEKFLQKAKVDVYL
jgi:Zn-dependent peptidase ImmA (M78 family)